MSCKARRNSNFDIISVRSLSWSNWREFWDQLAALHPAMPLHLPVLLSKLFTFMTPPFLLVTPSRQYFSIYMRSVSWPRNISGEFVPEFLFRMWSSSSNGYEDFSPQGHCALEVSLCVGAKWPNSNQSQSLCLPPVLTLVYCLDYLSGLKMEVTFSSETSVLKRSTRRHIPEDGIIHN
jgi:hypothetical protein